MDNEPAQPHNNREPIDDDDPIDIGEIRRRWPAEPKGAAAEHAKNIRIFFYVVLVVSALVILRAICYHFGMVDSDY